MKGLEDVSPVLKWEEVAVTRENRHDAETA
jgi:hypothetical protein